MVADYPPPEEEPRRKRRKIVKTPKDASINMTAMIDVVFLLIIFFMLVTEMSKMEIEAITLPYALSAKDDKADQQRIVVNLTENGKIFWMRKEHSPEQFLVIVKRAAGKAQRDPDGLPLLSVKIRADAQCEYKYVQEIMIQCMKAYVWKLSFGASPVDREEMLLYRGD